MSIASLSEVAKALPSNIDRTRSGQINALIRLSSGSNSARASSDVAAITEALGLQSEVSGLRAASVNVAQASSLLEVADGGLDEIQQGLDQLNSLATQANSGSLNDSQRADLQKQATQIVQQLQDTAEQTKFGSIHLLDGSFSQSAGFGNSVGSNTPDQIGLHVGDYRTPILFAKIPAIDLTSQQGAAEALDTIAKATAKTTSGRAGVGALQQRFNIASASLESAIQNQEAARSTLEDSDIPTDSIFNALSAVQSQSGVALLAQSNKLKAGVLDLLSH